MLGEDIGKRDRLPYTGRFDELVDLTQPAVVRETAPGSPSSHFPISPTASPQPLRWLLLTSRVRACPFGNSPPCQIEQMPPHLPAVSVPHSPSPPHTP